MILMVQSLIDALFQILISDTILLAHFCLKFIKLKMTLGKIRWLRCLNFIEAVRFNEAPLGRLPEPKRRTPRVNARFKQSN